MSTEDDTEESPIRPSFGLGANGITLDSLQIDQMIQMASGQVFRKKTAQETLEELGVDGPARLSVEEHQERMRRAFHFGPWLKPATDLKNLWQGETVCIVGSGPSLERTLFEILDLVADGAKIIAVNKTHDWLIERGIIPTFGILTDPKDWVAGYQTPHPDVIYILASQCHDTVFEKFKGHPRVYLMHCLGTHDDPDILINEAQKTGKSFFATAGGSTTTLRAFDTAALLLGFVGHHFFGIDSSGVEMFGMYPMDITKPHYDKINLTLQLNDPADETPLPQVYSTTVPMYHQARQFELLLADRKEGIKEGKYPKVRIGVHGRGMLPDWCALRGLHADPRRREQLLATKPKPIVAPEVEFTEVQIGGGNG